MATLTRQALQDLLTAELYHIVTLTLTSSYSVLYAPKAEQYKHTGYKFTGDHARLNHPDHPSIGIPYEVCGVANDYFSLLRVGSDGTMTQEQQPYPPKHGVLLEGKRLTLMTGNPIMANTVTLYMVYSVTKSARGKQWQLTSKPV